MRIKSTLVVVVMLLMTQTVGAQFGGRLNDLTNRLAAETAEFAESLYRNQSTSFRGGRADIEAMMRAQQFSASAQLFNRMVNDRRRNQDLREAFQILQELSRTVESSNVQRSGWFNIQRLMTDIGRELNLGNWNDSGSINNQYPDSNRSGRMTWRGRVDDDVRITVRGGTADLETIGGTPYNDFTQNFTAALPPRRVNVTLQVKRGRGEVFIEQQPSRENNYAAVVRIKDTRGGASDYEFDLVW